MRKKALKTSQAGFTLLEVLMALAIVAIALGAAVRVSAMAVDTAELTRERTLALWVAKNTLAEIETVGAWPDSGVRTSEKEMAGLSFMVKEEVTPSANPMFRKVNVHVYSGVDGDRLAASLSGYASRNR